MAVGCDRSINQSLQRQLPPLPRLDWSYGWMDRSIKKNGGLIRGVEEEEEEEVKWRSEGLCLGSV
uniref:Uncharacterized protein n=1 Tax=Oryza sativa subsp. japonica TaxID=39947 RepID=Q84Z03_ORYSJ|nr:hypothetical protein [Oryza sativa Japonica Group]